MLVSTFSASSPAWWWWWCTRNLQPLRKARYGYLFRAMPPLLASACSLWFRELCDLPVPSPIMERTSKGYLEELLFQCYARMSCLGSLVHCKIMHRGLMLRPISFFCASTTRHCGLSFPSWVYISLLPSCNHGCKQVVKDNNGAILSFGFVHFAYLGWNQFFLSKKARAVFSITFRAMWVITS